MIELLAFFFKHWSAVLSISWKADFLLDLPKQWVVCNGLIMILHLWLFLMIACSWLLLVNFEKDLPNLQSSCSWLSMVNFKRDLLTIRFLENQTLLPMLHRHLTQFYLITFGHGLNWVATKKLCWWYGWFWWWWRHPPCCCRPPPPQAGKQLGSHRHTPEVGLRWAGKKAGFLFSSTKR